MMTTNLTDRKNHKMQLTGNTITGDTYEISGFIKSYLDGKWNKADKSWTVNPEKLEKYLKANSIGLRAE
jgi:hypothetical protein